MAQDSTSSAPLSTAVDTSGDGWEQHSWKPLALAGGLIGGVSATIAGGLLAKRHRAGAVAAAACGLSLAGTAVGIAYAIIASFLTATHELALTESERIFLVEHPDAPEAELYRRTERIGRMICGTPPDSWEGYYAALEPEEEARIRENRIAEEQATWEWANTVSMRAEQLQAEDGVTLVGHVCEQSTPSRRWVVLVHGYHGYWNEMSQYAYRWAERGYNLLFPEMRAHGSSGGDLIGMGWLDRRDLVCWLHWLVETYGADISIVLHGHSMGAASSLLAAAEEDLPKQVEAVVSDCGYSDALNVFSPILSGGFNVPVHPSLELLRMAMLFRPGGYDLALASPEDAAARIPVPVLVLHGERDTFVPPYMARRIFDALPEGSSRIALFPGAGHCQSMCSDPQRYWDEVFSFIGNLQLID